MAYQLETGLEEYPELDTEGEELTVESDDRVVSSQPFDWTRSLSPVKDILRFPLHEPRKTQTTVTGKRWSAKGKTDWDVVGG